MGKDIYNLALTLTKGIGPVYSAKLMNELDSAEEFFTLSDREIAERLSGMPKKLRNLDKKKAIKFAENELEWAEKNDVRVITFDDKAYPRRLHHIPDRPLSLFVKGEGEIDPIRTIGIVGTRNATNYGKMWIEKLMRDLKPYGVQVISGLAYGIDIAAHQAALKNGMSTIAILGHGLSKIYPAEHRRTAREMLKQGAVITEFSHDEDPDRQHFPMRNRIIAGMSDAVIVVESGKKGGSMITANLTVDYNKDLFALPGRYNDKYSIGCNKLIKENKAQVILSAADLCEAMNWEPIGEKAERETQMTMFNDLSDFEKKLLNAIRHEKGMHIDQIAQHMEMPISKINTKLLQLEIKGLIKSLPGSKYITT